MPECGLTNHSSEIFFPKAIKKDGVRATFLDHKNVFLILSLFKGLGLLTGFANIVISTLLF